MKKTRLLFLAFLAVSFAFGQNKYLSFSEGEKDLQNLETMPQRKVLKSDKNEVEICFSFIGAYVSQEKERDTNYHFFHINGLPKMTQVGAPALPARNEVIAIPRGSKADLYIEEVKYKEYDGYNAYPALKPATDRKGDPEPLFEKNNQIYNSNEYFPARVVEITDIGLSRGTGLARIQIRPIQINPFTHKIRVYTSIKFKIKFIGVNNNFDYVAQENTLHYTNLLKRNVLNSTDIPDGFEITNNSKAGACNYIIITHSQYLTYANQLANAKRQLGYSVEVVSQSSWTSAQVKTAISSRYTAWTPKPDYFVIIGDHTGSYAVPGEIHQDPSYGDDFATDLYYACMDGAADYHPDMAHGRISVSSAAEAQVVIDKIVNYEFSPVNTASFYSNVLNCAQYQDDDDNDGYADRRFCHTSEDIRNYLISKGYTSTRVYNATTTFDKTQLHYNNGFYSDGQLLPADLRAVGFNWNGGATDITNAINAGKFLVTHRDHGYVGGSGWATPYYTTSSMTSLTNGSLLPVVFSINCHTGEFQLDNCFAEKFLRMSNKGAVGVFAAAYYSYSGFNDAMVEGMFDALWSDPGIFPDFGSGGTGTNYHIGTGNDIRTMGDLVNQGLYAMEQNWNGGAADDKYQYELFHYFGDPAMKIWTTNPNSTIITATHNPSITCSSTSLTITGSTPYATATLLHDNNLIGKVSLNASGAGTINYTITSAFTTATLTVSKQDCKPYVSTITITGTCGFPPTITSNVASSITTTTATVGGNITSIGGSAVTESGVVYSLNTNPTIGGAGVTKISTSPLVGTGTFSINLSSLSTQTTYYYKAYAINSNGTSYGEELSFTTACGIINSLPFSEGFSTAIIPNCWQNIDNQGNGQAWQFGTIASISPAFGSSNYAYLNSDAYGNGNSQNADLISPLFDLTSYTNVSLNFSHYFRYYNPSSATLYYSVNNGSTWVQVQQWGADITNPTAFSQVIAAVAGQSQVRFKWTYTGTWGYYWLIDNISITGTSSVCTPPTTQATTFTSSSITSTTMTVGWTRGNGNNVLVLAKAGSAVNSDPVSGTTYTANAAFGSGTQIGTGNYVVYSGPATSVNLTALTASTTYHFAVYEYATTGVCYKTPGLIGNATTIASGCIPPTTQATTFTSSAITATTMTAGWTRGNGNNVLVVAKAGSAVNSDPVSGTTYTANAAFGSGTQIGTGNYVVYSGPATSVNLTALSASTTYHFAVYEYATTGVCYKTPGLNGSASTLAGGCVAISTFPWTERFENGGVRPNCWTEENVTGTLAWKFQSGGQSGHPASAHTGSYNAFYYEGAYGTNNKTKLITPSLALGSASSATLSFWYANAVWTPDIDTLRVYYKTSAAGSWNLISSYKTDVPAWTEEVISLNNLSNDYYIAFEASENWGYGVVLDDVSINATISGSAPVSNFSGSPTTICSGGTVAYSDLSTNSPTSWLWSFTGGTPITSTSQNPSVTYASAGSYNVSLTVANSFGSNTKTSTNYITVNALPTANAGVDKTICNGNSTSLTATGGISYTWNTGANTASIAVNPMVNTTYTVTVANANGCTASDNALVTVNAVPTANAGIDQSICEGSFTSLTVIGGTSYTWNTGANTASITVSPMVNTTYTVTIANANGCTASDNAVVFVNTAPIVDAGPNIITCSDNPDVQLNGSVIGGAGTGIWTTNGSGYFSPSNTDLNATYHLGSGDIIIGSAVLSLTSTNSGVCTESTDQMNIWVISAGFANAGSDQTICVGSSTNLTATGGASYTWSTGANTSIIAVNPIVNTTYTVTVAFAGNCTESANVVVYVNANPEKPIINFINNQLISSSISGNQWFLEGVLVQDSVSQYFTPNINGNYQVQVTDYNACVSELSDIFIVETINLPDLDKASGKITIYPNPNEGKFSINFLDLTAQAVEIEILNTYGQSIYQDNHAVNKHDVVKLIDLSCVPKGVYYLKIKYNNTIFVQKIVKN